MFTVCPVLTRDAWSDLSQAFLAILSPVPLCVGLYFTPAKLMSTTLCARW